MAAASGVPPAVASMGPGSFDPGNAAAVKRIVLAAKASMGPGSFDPGNALVMPPVTSLPARFNGAGVF